tara:strand:- start:201 stop:428 length:228 start_codon:yes stop_codon:yes gene_type:complete
LPKPDAFLSGSIFVLVTLGGDIMRHDRICSIKFSMDKLEGTSLVAPFLVARLTYLNLKILISTILAFKTLLNIIY